MTCSLPDDDGRFGNGKPIVLRVSTYSAVVLPGAGGRVASLTWADRSAMDHDLIVPLTHTQFDEHQWPKGGGFPMLPFTNRMPLEGIALDGILASPEIGPHGSAIHGVAHRRAWKVTSSSNSSVVMELAVPAGFEGWPWAWAATQTIELSEGGLLLSIEVRNPGELAMPLSIGWHPYISVDGSTDDCYEFECQRRLGLDEVGRAVVGQRSTVIGGVGRGDTIAFQGWSGSARVRSSERVAVDLKCSGAKHLVVHRPARGNYICIEPVTVLPGWLGRMEDDAEACIRPGGSRRLSVTCAAVDV